MTVSLVPFIITEDQLTDAYPVYVGRAVQDAWKQTLAADPTGNQKMILLWVDGDPSAMAVVVDAGAPTGDFTAGVNVGGTALSGYTSGGGGGGGGGAILKPGLDNIP